MKKKISNSDLLIVFADVKRSMHNKYEYVKNALFESYGNWYMYGYRHWIAYTHFNIFVENLSLTVAT